MEATATEFVTMTHPDIDAPSGQVTRQAYEEVHRHKGWVVVDPVLAVASTALDVEVPDLDGLKKDELVKVAEELGLTVDRKLTNGELQDLIRLAAPAAPLQE